MSDAILGICACQEELNEILEKHRKWLLDEDGGECANLIDMDLSYANLSHAVLIDAIIKRTNLSHADLVGVNLEGVNLRYTSLSHADLTGANLTRTDLSDVDLKGADLDYSCLPLWCGSLTAHFDDRQLRQIAYHLVKAGLHSKNASPETKHELAKLIDFANEFHRADECGRIKWEE